MPHQTGAMRLAARALGLVKAVKSRQKRVGRADLNEREDAATKEKYIEEEARTGTPKEQEQSRPRTRSAALATGAGTSTLGKRKRAMGHNAITIHEDAQSQQIPPRKLRRMSATDRMQIVSSDDEVDEEQDASTDTDDEADESVVDDMRRLEESFTGISRKYRLINRIGEGLSLTKSTSNLI